MYALLVQAANAAGEHHLSLKSVFTDIPHDAAAFFVYALSAVAIGWVFIAGRRGPETPEGGESGS